MKDCPATVTEPDLDELPGLADTEKLAVPLPLPLPPDCKVTQLTLLEALQEQPPAAVTLTGTVPPAELTVWLVGEMEGLQATPDWVTAKDCPATVSVPIREAAVALGETEKVAFPLPEGLLAGVTEAQLTPLEALQEQPPGAVTLTDTVPPVELTVWLVGEMEGLQAAPDWVTVKLLPAMVMVPLCEAVAGLAETE